MIGPSDARKPTLLLVASDGTCASEPGAGYSRASELAGLFEECFGVDAVVALPAPTTRRESLTTVVSAIGFRSRHRQRRLPRRRLAADGRCDSTGVARLVEREQVTMVICVGVDASSGAVVEELASVGIPVAVLLEGSVEADAERVSSDVLDDVTRHADHVLCATASIRDGFEHATRDARRKQPADRHLADVALLSGESPGDRAFFMLEQLMPDLRRVSVVVPNYNYARYLPERLMSVFEQHYPVYETIVLDDASSDDSVHVVERIARAGGRRIRLETNSVNGGNVFAQWQKGLELSRGDLLWIAEADDFAEPVFLGKSVAAIQQSDAQLSFCDSRQVGSRGESLAASYDYYYRQVDPRLFRDDFTMSGAELADRALAERNVILNVSAVVWQREALQEALIACEGELVTYRLVGDWCLYLEVLLHDDARVAYIAQPLNVHRRHPVSVTHALDADRHLAEILMMHERARRVLRPDPAREERIAAYVDELQIQFGLKHA